MKNLALITLISSVTAAALPVTKMYPSNCYASAATPTDPYVSCSSSLCCSFSNGEGANLLRCMSPS